MSLTNQLIKRSQEIRLRIMEMVRHAKRGHISTAFSSVEIMVVLYDWILRIRPEDPEWLDRDRFILSKGHGCLSLYALLADKNFFPLQSLKEFCSFDGILGGHPTCEKIPGVEASTGSLGHGLSIGIGQALAAKIDKRDFRVFVLLGDGECDEGSVWEGAMAASKHQLDNLIVLVDYNKCQSYSSTYEVCNLEPLADKWESFGFLVRDVDMVNQPLELKNLLSSLPIERGKPLALICHTIKGAGVSFMENNLDWHHKSNITDAEIDTIIDSLMKTKHA